MIRNSFIFLDKVSHLTEKKIWQQGIHSWDDFLNTSNIDGISILRKGYYDRQIKQARKCLYDYESEHFTKVLPRSEHWRLYNYFKDDTCFLDIETTGYYGDITVIGLFNGTDVKTMVKGHNLNLPALKEELKRHKLIVTFNGSSFDLPVIEKYYPTTVPKIPHLDLRHACAKIGLKGGLKNVERTMGIRRADEVGEMSGNDAVYLWQKYKITGDRKYLELLVKYNEEDIINLKPLADHTVKELWKKIKNSV
ncbi:ribonuclease H-like domain-containing protein [Nanoarchaeota archaeon]